MNILITGVPGTGKSEISKELAKKLKLKVINDKEFAKKNNLGKEKKIDSSKEYVVNLKNLILVLKIKKKMQSMKGTYGASFLKKI
jgi:broad-specificity NMP kinase